MFLARSCFNFLDFEKCWNRILSFSYFVFQVRGFNGFFKSTKFSFFWVWVFLFLFLCVCVNFFFLYLSLDSSFSLFWNGRFRSPCEKIIFFTKLVLERGKEEDGLRYKKKKLVLLYYVIIENFFYVWDIIFCIFGHFRVLFSLLDGLDSLQI